jgi:hypothetical protein
LAKATKYREKAMRLRAEAANEARAELKQQLLRMADQYDRLATSSKSGPVFHGHFEFS